MKNDFKRHFDMAPYTWDMHELVLEGSHDLGLSDLVLDQDRQRMGWTRGIRSWRLKDFDKKA
jgi:hypothetical protein